MSKQQVVEEIHKQARKNFQRRHVKLKGLHDLWQADLIDIKNIANVNNNFKYILVVIDCLSKYVWVFSLKTKSKEEIFNKFSKLFKTGSVPKNLQTDFGTEFYNAMFKKLMNDYGINHYSTYSTKKASIVERVIRTLKNKLYKYFSLVGNYKWLGKPLENVVTSYNNTVHRSTRYKPVDVNFGNVSKVLCNIKKSQKCNNTLKAKFKIGDFVRISKYKGSFEKGYTPNWSTEVFTVIKVNKTCPITYYIKDQNNQIISGIFYQEELKKSICPNVYLIEKVIKKRGRKLFVKWLGLSEKENSWIDKSALV